MKTERVILIFCSIYWINLFLSLFGWYVPTIFMGFATLISFCLAYYDEYQVPEVSKETAQKRIEFRDKLREDIKKAREERGQII